jgi:hypothetical protein
MNVRAVCDGQFTLPLPMASAMPLFTPEGERRWAGPSWNPVYAISTAPNADGSSPGTVFTTESDGGDAIWVVLERRDDAVSYARVAPGRTAGTVAVSCTPSSSRDETGVTVCYDITSLGPDGIAFVENLRTGYQVFLDGWRTQILAALWKAP